MKPLKTSHVWHDYRINLFIVIFTFYSIEKRMFTTLFTSSDDIFLAVIKIERHHFEHIYTCVEPYIHLYTLKQCYKINRVIKKNRTLFAKEELLLLFIWLGTYPTISVLV